MLGWYFNLLSELHSFFKRKHKRGFCKSSCLFCEYWEDCRFIEDIDGIATEASKGYDVGHKDGLAEENYINKTRDS